MTLATARLPFDERWFSTALRSIGDAVIATDDGGRVLFVNPVAEALTGWDAAAAIGRGLAEVFSIVNEVTRDPIEDPVAKVLALGQIVGLANHTVLIARDGREMPIDDSAAPILDDAGPGRRRHPRLPRRDGEAAGRAGQRAAGGDRRVVGRHHRLEDARRRHHQLEPGAPSGSSATRPTRSSAATSRC